MERLSDTEIDIINDLHTERLHYQSEYVPLIDAANRLSDYEDTGLAPEGINELLHKSYGPLHKKLGEWIKAEQEKRMMVLPCYIGQDVWYNEFWGDEICPATVTGIELNGNTPQCMLWIRIKYTSAMIGVHEYCGRADMALGKTIFLTREEAEEALKNRSEGSR